MACLDKSLFTECSEAEIASLRDGGVLSILRQYALALRYVCLFYVDGNYYSGAFSNFSSMHATPYRMQSHSECHTLIYQIPLRYDKQLYTCILAMLNSAANRVQFADFPA